jgi:hypothetical protein
MSSQVGGLDDDLGAMEASLGDPDSWLPGPVVEVLLDGDGEDEAG